MHKLLLRKTIGLNNFYGLVIIRYIINAHNETTNFVTVQPYYLFSSEKA